MEYVGIVKLWNHPRPHKEPLLSTLLIPNKGDSSIQVILPQV